MYMWDKKGHDYEKKKSKFWEKSQNCAIKSYNYEINVEVIKSKQKFWDKKS